MDVLIPLVAAVLGVLVGYGLSGRRAQTEWRYQKRAEVLAGVYARLSAVQTSAGLATLPDVPLEARRQRISQNRAAAGELTLYMHAHALWLDARMLPTIDEFVRGLASALQPYEAEVNRGEPDSPLAVAAAEHVRRIVPEAELVLEEEFRAIVYPPPWWEYPLRGLERFEAHGRS